MKGEDVVLDGPLTLRTGPAPHRVRRLRHDLHRVVTPRPLEAGHVTPLHQPVVPVNQHLPGLREKPHSQEWTEEHNDFGIETTDWSGRCDM